RVRLRIAATVLGQDGLSGGRGRRGSRIVDEPLRRHAARSFLLRLGPLTADLRQVGRPGLGTKLASRLAVVLGFTYQRIVDDGLIEDGEQVFARRGGGGQATQPQ